MDVQQQCECIVGIHYPQPMIEFKEASSRNRQAMSSIRESIMAQNLVEPEHCRPSDEAEIRKFFWINEAAEPMQAF